MDDKSFGDINKLFSYTQSRNPKNATDDEVFRAVGRYVKGKVKTAAHEVKETAKFAINLMIEEMAAKLMGRTEEYKDWKCAVILHPEWDEYDRDREWAIICDEHDRRKLEKEAEERERTLGIPKGY